MISEHLSTQRRRRVLEALLGAPPAGAISFSTLTEGDGALVFEHACGMGLECLICKPRDAPYRSGKSHISLKVKCVQRDIFTIVGFVPDRDAIAALLARRAASSLVYVGKVGTGSRARPRTSCAGGSIPCASRRLP